MNILGINSVFHESSAALIIDGEVVAACEEERFNRIKHAKEARVENPHEASGTCDLLLSGLCGASGFRDRPRSIFVRSEASPSRVSCRVVA